MELSDQVAAVSRMQAYINEHLEGDITLNALCAAAGYSKYHAVRMFKALTGRTPFETVRAMRLTKAAQTLQANGIRVTDAALNSGFESHDGFTRAFSRQFDITPQEYQRRIPPVAYFVQHPIEAYYVLKEGANRMPQEAVSGTVTVTTVERPARKLIFLRIPTATDYFAACEEVGCEWEGYFNSIPEKFDTAAGGRLPQSLITPGTGGHGFFVEVPLAYDKPLAEGYEITALPPCTYLYFNGMPYDDENDFPTAIGIVMKAIREYPLERFGWRKSDTAPELNMGAGAETGARMAVPVERL